MAQMNAVLDEIRAQALNIESTHHERSAYNTLPVVEWKNCVKYSRSEEGGAGIHNISSYLTSISTLLPPPFPFSLLYLPLFPPSTFSLLPYAFSLYRQPLVNLLLH